jgi:hypothetical protein
VSTRSIIGRPAGDGFEGRYCHWDGYPTGRGPQVWATVKELGVEGAIQYALKPDAKGYWSSFVAPSELVQVRETWVADASDSLMKSWEDDCGTEWAYVISDTALTIFERRFGKSSADQGHGTGMFGLGASDTVSGGYWALVATCKWDDPEPNWLKIEQGLGSDEREEVR